MIFRGREGEERGCVKTDGAPKKKKKYRNTMKATS